MPEFLDFSHYQSILPLIGQNTYIWQKEIIDVRFTGE